MYKKRNKDNGNGTNLDIRFSVCSDNPQDLDPLPDLRMHYLRHCPPDWATGRSEMWQLLFFPLQVIVHEISFLGSKFVVNSLTTDSCSLSLLFFHFLILFSIHSGGY